MARGWEGVGHGEQADDELEPQHGGPVLAANSWEPLIVSPLSSEAGSAPRERGVRGCFSHRKRDNGKVEHIKRDCKKQDTAQRLSPVNSECDNTHRCTYRPFMHSLILYSDHLTAATSSSGGERAVGSPRA